MNPIRDIEDLESRLSEPTDYLIDALRSNSGDFVILGVGGKMGPSLGRMLVRACQLANHHSQITAVSRFTTPGIQDQLDSLGIRTIAGDLLDPAFVATIPKAENVIHMTSMKFGTGDQAHLTWAMNTYLPSLVCRHFSKSRIMAFSTGNVYPLVRHDGPWSNESDDLVPVGEYGMSALGRERIFQYFSRQYEIPVSLVRLNYSVEMRYGVLVDIAKQVRHQQTIDLSMGYANVIWQADANAMALAALFDTSVPANVINVAGPELVKVKDVAERFGDSFGVEPKFVNKPTETALLNDGSVGHKKYAPPRVSLDQLIDWIADWISREQPTHAKPTHFQVRSGKF